MQSNNVKSFFVGAFTFIYTLTIFNFLNPSETSFVATFHKNNSDFKIAQYSDIEITENAIKTDPQYKNIAFEKSGILSTNNIAAVVESIKSPKLETKKDQTKENGSWVWTPTLSITPEYADFIINQSKINKINVIYISLDSYLDIFVMPKNEEREIKKQEFTNKIQNFIKKANDNGILVDAEAGWRNWAEEGNEYKSLAILNYVKNYNETHLSKFRGFQYDVEPYLLENYVDNEKNILKNLVSLIDKTERFLQNTDLRFSVVIPDFYDKKDKATPKFSYSGKDGYVLDHILNILDNRPNNSIIVMSYRNFAEGQDGSIEVSKNEMETSKKYNTRIIIAQETGDVPPPYITFHNTSKKYFSKEVSKINNAFSSYPNFAGIAIHYTNAFLALR